MPQHIKCELLVGKQIICFRQLSGFLVIQDDSNFLMLLDTPIPVIR